MYYIENKLTTTTKLYESIDAMMLELNSILSNLYDEHNSLISIECINKTIIYKINKTVLISNLMPIELKYFPYLVLHKNIISQHLIQNQMTPEFLLNIFTSKKCIINPYNVLINIFNINEELIYQTLYYS